MRDFSNGSNFSLNASHSRNISAGDKTFDAYDNTAQDLLDPLSSQQSDSEVSTNVTVARMDYTYPFSKSANLETGLKTTIRNIDNDFLLQTLNQSTGAYETDFRATNNFQYDEQVHAAYAAYKTSAGSWEYYGGLRLEQTMIDTRLVRTDETNAQNYLSVFPSAKLRYQLNDKQSVKATYSRRIDRPSSRRLNPFVDVSDSLNIYRGDPNMQPEFISSFELGHQIDLEKVGFTSTLFYRYVKNQMDWVSRIQPEDGFAYRGPANLDYGNNLGLEFITMATLIDWWELNASVTVFYASIVGEIEGVNYSNSNITTNTQINSTFTLPWDVSAQLTFEYEGPEAEAQGTEEARYNFDIGLKKTVLEDGYVSFNARDIFNTLARKEESSGPGFEQYREHNWQSRVIQLGVGYQF